MLWTENQGSTPAAVNDSENRAEMTLATLDCSQPEATPFAADTDYLAACDGALHTKYLLGPSALSGTHVSSAKARQANGLWQIDVNFDAAGAQAFGDLTATMAGTGQMIAITVGGVVESAPSVQAPITDGKLQITGQFDKAKADELAGVLTAGAQG